MGESNVTNWSDKRKDQMMSQLYLVNSVLNEVYLNSVEYHYLRSTSFLVKLFMLFSCSRVRLCDCVDL